MSQETIAGSSAVEIVESVRDLRERSVMRGGDRLPPVRALAEQLGVNRNTVVAAYRLLTRAGVIVTRGRGGTFIADGHGGRPEEGFSGSPSLRDIGTGNPDPARIPDLTPFLRRIAARPVLYGEPVIDDGLAGWAQEWMAPDTTQPERMRLTVAGGAVDAVERLLAQSLVRDDAVALEDPCFLSSINTVRLGGYRPIPVAVDDEGMTVDGLRAALDQGARAVLLTPRAQNPTGVSLSARRAAALRRLLSAHPYVLVIEDDYFSLLSRHPFRSVIGPSHRRWALVRSVSKFLGPDMCLAMIGSDPETAERLALRLSPGTTWVSHLLQRLAHGVLVDGEARSLIEEAGAHYADRNAEFTERLSAAGLHSASQDGINLWVELPIPARDASEQLMRRGWLARTGDEFQIATEPGPSRCLRLTVHDLERGDADRLVSDLASAIASVG